MDENLFARTGGDESSAAPRIAVLIPLPLAGPYDYLIPDGMALTRGDLVTVPLGPRVVRGVVWGPGTEGVDSKKLKPVADLLAPGALPPQLCDFVDWVASYTLAAQGAVLALALRAPDALKPAPVRPMLTRSDRPADGFRLTDARRRVLEKAGSGVWRASALAEAAGVSTGVVHGLVKAGLFDTLERSEDPLFPEPDQSRGGLSLSDTQTEAAFALTSAVKARRFQPLLLDGVTGSGKTEVYFEAVAAALAEGRQVLILLPEIALTIQSLARFERRFGCRPAEWHSDLSAKARRRVWRHTASGQAKIVVGARSALFLPFADLGLIIVDEEHDAAFKQEEGVIYHARDMAVVRARIAGCPICLASATPSLESIINADSGRYAYLKLPERAGGARLPDIKTVDVTAAPPEKGRWLAPPLVHAVEQALARGEQGLLFLNRRGYAPVTVCKKCGHHLVSPESSAFLVEHRYLGLLVDHHTGFTMRKPERCPKCDAPDSLAPYGPGVERLSEEVAERFPQARLAIMSSDLIRSPKEAEALIAAMDRKEIDLLIGTQMVAKGHHFPNLTLVAVVDADLGLKGGDLRAAERTYQLLHQVGGRAGRGERPGEVLLQTAMPNHPVIAALMSGDRDAFLACEADSRRLAEMPPYGRLAAVILSAPDHQEGQALARRIGEQVPRTEDVEVWGPAPAPLAVVRGRYRYRFLLKAGRGVDIQGFLKAWLERVKVPGRARLAVDIDPYSFL